METEVDETNCEYVSSRGILKSCSVHNPNPRSSCNFFLDVETFWNIQSGDIVYLSTESIPNFLENFFPNLEGPIVIVSGDSDLAFPKDIFKEDEWKTILENPCILHWFAQNNTETHPKLTSIPIGLDYHTVAKESHLFGKQMSPLDQEKRIHEIAEMEPDLSKKERKAYGNFTIHISRGNRRDAFREIPKELIDYEKIFIPRDATWQKQALYAFTVSPHGNGLDCHRTWETLVLGGIPIVQTSVLDTLYEGLPVVIVKEWADINQELLETTIQEFQRKTFQTEKLSLKYWTDKIKAAAKIE